MGKNHVEYTHIPKERGTTMEGNKKKDTVSLMLSMFIFGTIGIFVRHIAMPSSLIALCRGVIGKVFLLVVTRAKGSRISAQAVRKNIALLIISGGLIGFNWIMLFEAYRYTTVATATLCYYLAPVFMILASPLVLREKLTAKRLICAAVALFGMVFVSGVPESGLPSVSEASGIVLGVGAAVFYATVILLNKKMKGIGSYDMTIVQLGVSAVVVLPYVLVTVDASQIQVSGLSMILLLVMGVVHTGFAYAMYFGSVGSLKGQTVAIYSYIDPVVAIILSAALLREGMSLWGAIGAVLVLGSTLVSELSGRKG